MDFRGRTGGLGQAFHLSMAAADWVLRSMLEGEGEASYGEGGGGGRGWKSHCSERMDAVCPEGGERERQSTLPSALVRLHCMH